MENPWLQLIGNFENGEYILPGETSVIEAFNRVADPRYRICTDIFPAPFMGDVHRSPVVLLTLNPGYDDRENENGFYKRYAGFWKNEIQHKPSVEHLRLFCLEEEYGQWSRYWAEKLKPLMAVAGREAVANSISVIQYFPYHSRKYKDIPKRMSGAPLPSQAYNFGLVEMAIGREAVIVLLRGRKRWLDAVPALQGYKNCLVTHSALNPVLSERNLGEGFERICSRLK